MFNSILSSIRFQISQKIINALPIDEYMARVKDKFAEHSNSGQGLVDSAWGAINDTLDDAMSGRIQSDGASPAGVTSDGVSAEAEGTESAGQGSAEISLTEDEYNAQMEAARQRGQQEQQEQYNSMGFLAKLGSAFGIATAEAEKEMGEAEATAKSDGKPHSETVEEDMAAEGMSAPDDMPAAGDAEYSK